MRNRGKVFIALGLLFITAALCLVAYNLADGRRAERSASETVEELEAQIQEATAAREELLPVEDALPPEILPDYVLNPDMEMPVETMKGVDYIGILRIPALELELPIISQWSYSRLRLAPCRYTGSAYKNDMAICAHNYSRHFGRLRRLRPGDSVSFTDVDGNVFYYEVIESEALNLYAVDEMVPGDWDLTLFTCTVGGQSRFTVRCEAVPAP